MSVRERTAMQIRRAQQQGKNFCSGGHTTPVFGEELKQKREGFHLSIDEMAGIVGLEAHVLAGVEKGHRKLTRPQYVGVQDGLAHLSQRAVAIAAAARMAQRMPGASRPPLPDLTEPEGAK